MRLVIEHIAIPMLVEELPDGRLLVRRSEDEQGFIIDKHNTGNRQLANFNLDSGKTP